MYNLEMQTQLSDKPVFRKLTKLAIMAILTSKALLREKNPVAPASPTLLFYTNLTCAAQEIFKLLFMHHLMFGLR